MERFTISQDITTKLKKGLYATIEDVETEFALMAHNARMYNLDTSPVFAECESLREEFHLKTAKIREHFELPDPPPFVVDANQSIPTPVLLDEHGVNIAIFTPPGVRPPLPERSRGYIIYNMGLVKPSNVALKTPTPAPNSSSSSSSSSGYKNNGGDVGPRSSSSSSNLVAQQQQQQQPAAKQQSTPQDQTIKKRPGPKPKRTASSDTIDAMDETYSPDRKKSKKDAVPGGGGKEEKLYLSLFIPKKPSSASNSTDGVESVSSSSSYTEKAEKPEKGQNQGPESKGPLPRGSKVKLKGMGRWPV
jgi:Bromodomain